MLIQLLDYRQNGETHSVQELAELMQKDAEDIRIELEYLERQGYIRRVPCQKKCDHDCSGCHSCDQSVPKIDIWEVTKR